MNVQINQPNMQGEGPTFPPTQSQDMELEHADAYLQTGLVAEAAEIYERVEEAAKDSLEAQIGLARCAYMRRNLHEALGRLQAVTRADADYPGAANDLGVVYFELGLPHKAREEFLRAAAQSEEDPVPWRNLVDVATALQDFAACKDYCERVLSLDPADEEIEDLLDQIRRL